MNNLAVSNSFRRGIQLGEDRFKTIQPVIGDAGHEKAES